MKEEKQYNHIYRKLAIIFYVISIILIFVGVFLIFNTISSDFWNDIPSDESYGINYDFIVQIIMITFGGILFFAATILLIIDTAKSKIFKGFGKGLIDKVVSTATYVQTTYQDKMSEHKKNNIVYCKYCGTALDGTEKKCPSCGASN